MQYVYVRERCINVQVSVMQRVNDVSMYVGAQCINIQMSAMQSMSERCINVRMSAMYKCIGERNAMYVDSVGVCLIGAGVYAIAGRGADAARAMCRQLHDAGRVWCGRCAAHMVIRSARREQCAVNTVVRSGRDAGGADSGTSGERPLSYVSQCESERAVCDAENYGGENHTSGIDT